MRIAASFDEGEVVGCEFIVAVRGNIKPAKVYRGKC